MSHASVFLEIVGEKRPLTPLRKVIIILTKIGRFPARKVDAIVGCIANYVVGWNGLTIKIL
jgi:hypothetical protein